MLFSYKKLGSHCKINLGKVSLVSLCFLHSNLNSAKWFEERRAARGVLPGRLWTRFDHHVQCIDAIPNLSASRLNLYLGRQGTTLHTRKLYSFKSNADAGFGSDGHCSISRDPQFEKP